MYSLLRELGQVGDVFDISLQAVFDLLGQSLELQKALTMEPFCVLDDVSTWAHQALWRAVGFLVELLSQRVL
jgi:hypothetical protein